MNSYPVASLKPGMKFDAPVYIDNETLFLPEMVAIKERDLTRLQQWQISEVKSAGAPIDPTADPEGAAGSNFLNAIFRSPEYRKVIASYSDLTHRMEEVHKTIHNRLPISTDDIDAVVAGLNGELAHRSDELIQYILYGLHGESTHLQNALNCTVLSILLAREMGIVEHKIVELATAALMHDIGMLRLPDEIVSKSGKLTGEELQQVKTHPIYSYKILVRELGYPDGIGQAALQHQERWDGAGYPKGLKGDQIVLHARIIAIADAFEAMISRRPYRDPMIGYRAMRTILSDNGRRFDPDILKVFIQTMGLYPLGSVVLLNNAAVGRVVAVNKGAPLRPVVKLMIDETGAEKSYDDGEMVDLSTTRQMFIVRAVDPKDVRPENISSKE